MSPLPVVVMFVVPDDVTALPGNVPCVTLVFVAASDSDENCPLITKGTPGSLATLRTSEPTFALSVPTLFRTPPSVAEVGGPKPVPAPMVSVPTDSGPEPVPLLMVLEESELDNKFRLAAAIGAKMSMEVLCSVTEADDVMADPTVTLPDPLATSDALLSVIGALVEIVVAVNDKVDGLPPAATVSGALTVIVFCAASVTLVVASSAATLLAVILLATPGYWFAVSVLPERS